MSDIVERLRREGDGALRKHLSLGLHLICTEAADEIERLRSRAERLRLELEKIGWMDEFLDADGAKAMMNIARDAVNADEK